MDSEKVPTRQTTAAAQGADIAKKSGGAMEIVGSILTVILLLFVFPLGLLSMWFFTSWPKVVKAVVTVFFLLIGIWLGFIGVTVYRGLNSGAKDAQRRTDIQTISKAIEEHYDAKSGQYLPPQSVWFKDGKIPQDPSGGNYQGIPTGPVSEFKICAKLEVSSSGPSNFCGESQR